MSHNRVGYHKKYYEDNKETIDNYQKEYRDEHKEEIELYKKKYYEDHKEEIKLKNKKRQEKNKDIYNFNRKKKYNEDKDYRDKTKLRNKEYGNKHKEEINNHAKEYYENNKEKIKPRMSAYGKQYHEELRLEALSHYSPTLTCICCGECNIEFLTIDHINNDGAEHRRNDKKARQNIYKWLKDNNYPPGFQILCHNCNQCKGSFGECFHQNKNIEYKNYSYFKNKLKSLRYYSNNTMKCVCCGTDIIFFLAIDHINGGGNKHRKKLKETSKYKWGDFYYWLVNNKFPPGFRVLCHNCNSSLGFYGYCPHGNEIPTEVGYKYTEHDEDMFL